MLTNKFRAYCVHPESDSEWFEYSDVYKGMPDLGDPLCEVNVIEYGIGVNDSNEKEYYVGDKGLFPNGDTFIIKMEDWLEVYIDWVGEAQCEDQACDLPRISDAVIIGNIHGIK